ncbi:hypothetical protein L6452_26369 [Arctium lappa]|uniref:Uncharacterized protein n=1 Tax=Arctium lappa TaxID=4217 RepID=A0ACB9AH22_ARCLA|nr:hypothetical protein L6452_26369 [Arctium lappa]
MSIYRSKWPPPFPFGSHDLNHTSAVCGCKTFSNGVAPLFGTSNLEGTFTADMCDLVTFAISMNTSVIESATFSFHVDNSATCVHRVEASTRAIKYLNDPHSGCIAKEHAFQKLGLFKEAYCDNVVASCASEVNDCNFIDSVPLGNKKMAVPQPSIKLDDPIIVVIEDL